LKIFALTTRGLEPISEIEMRAVSGMAIEATAYRRIEADYTGPLAALLRLTTVDDVFIRLAAWDEIGHTRDNLSLLGYLSESLDMQTFLAALTDVRSEQPLPVFSITANFVGKRNYSVPEIKQAVADGVLSVYPDWQYVDDDRNTDLNLRLFIEHDRALVGLRIGQHSLHRRPYKQHHLPGSLKPPVAAAMIQLAGLQPGQIMLDPFCGAGTIVIEAVLQGIVAVGGDVLADAVKIAQADLPIEASHAAFFQWDAQRLPFADSSADSVISNLPWGKQVSLTDDLPTLYRASFAEMQRIVKPGGSIVLLTNQPELLEHVPDSQIEISLFGETPTIARFKV
jgi:tRNA (guanine6-N2)-methyltransferase